MAITGFPAGTETALDNMATDLLVTFPTIDDDVPGNENAQLLIWCYALVKAVRARQRAAASGDIAGANRDRAFELVGPHTSFAFLGLLTMIDEVYNEFRIAFNNVDQNETNDDDEPWGVNILTNGTGPARGPLH